MATVIIEHKDGRRYAVELVDFRRKNGMDESYEGQGFQIVSYEDGTLYEEPKRATAEKPQE